VDSKFNLKGKPINTGEGYFTAKTNGIVFYFKDMELHRDLGPAIFLEKDKDKLFTLGDENLYNPMTWNNLLIPNLAIILFLKAANIWTNYYYLNGVSHTEEEFNSILDKKNLQKELIKELPVSPNQSRKPKV
jgi:hypothetical protein